MTIGVTMARPKDRAGGGDQIIDAGKERLFQYMRLRRDAVLGADPQNRRIEIVERHLLHRRSDLAGEAADVHGGAGDHAAPGLLHRTDHRLDVERHQAAQVDDLCLTLFSAASRSAALRQS